MTRIIVGVLGVAAYLVMDGRGRVPLDANPALYFVGLGSIAVSVVASWLFWFQPASNGGGTDSGALWNWKLRQNLDSHPITALAWDFVNMAILTITTGGFRSIFLPLFLIGLLLGDVALESSKRNRAVYAFLVALMVSVIVPLTDARCAVVNLGESPCAETLWGSVSNLEVGIGLALFIGGSLFGSAVLRSALDRMDAVTKEAPPEARHGTSPSEEDRRTSIRQAFGVLIDEGNGLHAELFSAPETEESPQEWKQKAEAFGRKCHEYIAAECPEYVSLFESDANLMSAAVYRGPKWRSDVVLYLERRIARLAELQSKFQ